MSDNFQSNLPANTDGNPIQPAPSESEQMLVDLNRPITDLGLGSLEAPKSSEVKAQERALNNARKLPERLTKAEIEAADAEVRKKELAAEKERHKLEEEEDKQNDRRQRILEAVRVAVPRLLGKREIGKDLEDVSAPEFTQNVQLYKLDPLEMDADPATSDFFLLEMPLRKDLLDRIGFRRGLVVDHSNPDLIVQSFNNALADPFATTDEIEDLQDLGIVPTRVFYRKPRQSGYFDNKFTLSEFTQQYQKNGISNMSVALTVAIAAATWSAGVGAAYTTETETDISRVTTGRRVYITSSYILPKVELSFDYMMPCASDEFVRAIGMAMGWRQFEPEDVPVVERVFGSDFERLLMVFQQFGHFVPTTMIVGGKLYATDMKEVKTLKEVSSVAEKRAVEVKAKLETKFVTAEADYKKSDSTRVQDSNTQKNEAQEMVFTAIGGEGTYISNANRWAHSAAPYTHWNIVQFDGLRPSIEILPAYLYHEVIAFLRAHVEKLTARELLKLGAHFMFYGPYNDLLGKYARRVYVQIVSQGQVLSLPSGIPYDGMAVVTKDAGTREEASWWYHSPEGYLIAQVQRGETEYVLTAGAQTDSTSLQLKLATKGRAPAQTWDYVSGYLINVQLDGPFVLTLERQTVVLKARQDGVPSQLWDFVTRQDPTSAITTSAGSQEGIPAETRAASMPKASESTMSGQSASQSSNQTQSADLRPPFAIRNGNNVVSIRFEKNANRIASDLVVTLEPEIGAPHQYWRLTPDGDIVSMASPNGEEYTLTILPSPVVITDKNNKEKSDKTTSVKQVVGVTRRIGNGTTHQWRLQEDRYLYSVIQNKYVQLLNMGEDDLGALLTADKTSANESQVWTFGAVDTVLTSDLPKPAPFVPYKSSGMEDYFYLTSVKLDRPIRAMRLYFDGDYMFPQVLVDRGDGFTDWVGSLPSKPAAASRIDSADLTLFDTSVTYFPTDRKVLELGLMKTVNRLSWHVKSEGRGWMQTNNLSVQDGFSFPVSSEGKVYYETGYSLVPVGYEAVGIGLTKASFDGDVTVRPQLWIRPDQSGNKYFYIALESDPNRVVTCDSESIFMMLAPRYNRPEQMVLQLWTQDNQGHFISAAPAIKDKTNIILHATNPGILTLSNPFWNTLESDEKRKLWSFVDGYMYVRADSLTEVLTATFTALDPSRPTSTLFVIDDVDDSDEGRRNQRFTLIPASF